MDMFSKISKTISAAIVSAFAIMATAVSLPSCSLVNDGTDCVESYTLLKFVFDHNMSFADAFDHEVDAVSILVFDAESGTLVRRMDVPHAELSDDNSVPLSIAPGRYNILVWGGNHGEHFDIAAGKPGESTLADFHCRTLRDIDNDGTHHVRTDLAGLYHAIELVDLPYASPSAPYRLTVKLKKNTNTFRIVLQDDGGEPVDDSKYDIVITDNNGWLNHDNTLRDLSQLSYHPWYTFSGNVEVNTNPVDVSGKAQAPVARSNCGAALAELTTGRLLTGNKPMLTITRKNDGGTVLSVPVIDYALLVKGFYHKEISDQEYLDRQDEYNMTFFLKNGKWASSTIIINNWRIVRNDVPAM